jgi:hypothetical protein
MYPEVRELIDACNGLNTPRTSPEYSRALQRYQNAVALIEQRPGESAADYKQRMAESAKQLEPYVNKDVVRALAKDLSEGTA